MRLNKIQENYLYLFFIQGANNLIPVVILYYLSNIIGPKNLGLLNFSQALINYFILIVSYGFDLTATRDIANKNNDINEIFNSVIFSKLVLFIFSILAFFIVIKCNLKLQENFGLHLSTFLGIFGLMLFPTWFFQGIQDLRLLSIFNAVTKILLGIFSYLIIKNENDYWYYNLSLSVAQVIVGIISFVYVYKKFQLKFYVPSFLKIKAKLNNGFTIFLTIAIISIYTNSNTFILGIYKSSFDVGIFAAALKIEMIFQTLFVAMVTQALFPAIGSAISKDFKTGIDLWKKASWKIVLFNFIGFLVLYFSANNIITFFYGAKYISAVPILKLLSPIPFIISISSSYGIQLMINLKKDKQYFYFTCLGALVGIILNFTLINKYGYYGTCISWIMAEIVVSFLCFTYIHLQKIFDK